MYIGLEMMEEQCDLLPGTVLQVEVQDDGDSNWPCKGQSLHECLPKELVCHEGVGLALDCGLCFYFPGPSLCDI